MGGRPWAVFTEVGSTPMLPTGTALQNCISRDEAMKTMNGRKNDQPHVEKNSLAWETQAIISSGEELLFRAHEVAHEIEQHIREVLARSERDSSKS
jgi:predicted RNA-binding Zn ribbon-like protein